MSIKSLFLKLLSVIFDNNLTIKKYKIKTDRLSVNESIRIVLISDLHSQIYGENQNEILKKIIAQEPNIIALAGDMVDAVKSMEGTKQFLKAIQGTAPIYYVTGNHEFRSEQIIEIRNLFQKYQVNILENDFQEIQINNTSIIIAGMDDPSVVMYEKPDMDWNKQLISGFSELKNRTQFKILLCHRPDLVDLYKQTPFNLVLSGHAHGGHVRIPYLLNGLFAPNQGLFPKYAGGLYQYKNITHIVSRGACYNPRLPRIFNPPEVVVIDIFPN